MNPLVPLADIRAAQAALPAIVRRTPLLRSDALSREGAGVFLKCENLQVTGSYKARAAFTILDRLSAEQKQRGAALSSSGNFAGAFAYAGRRLGVPACIVMMQKTSPFKIERTRRYGGEVVLCEDRYESRYETLARLERERGVTAIYHAEDANVIAGHGTLGLEMVQQLDEVDTVLVPISTGGLIAGVAAAVKELRPTARVVGVQPQGSNAMYLSWQAGKVVRIPQTNTVCDALTAEYPGELTLAHALRYVDDIVLVADEEALAAAVWLAEQEKLVVEPGGAATVAALRSGRVTASGRTIALLSGGNVPLEKLGQWKVGIEDRGSMIEDRNPEP